MTGKGSTWGRTKNRSLGGCKHQTNLICGTVCALVSACVNQSVRQRDSSAVLFICRGKRTCLARVVLHDLRRERRAHTSGQAEPQPRGHGPRCRSTGPQDDPESDSCTRAPPPAPSLKQFCAINTSRKLVELEQVLLDPPLRPICSISLQHWPGKSRQFIWSLCLLRNVAPCLVSQTCHAPSIHVPAGRRASSGEHHFLTPVHRRCTVSLDAHTHPLICTEEDAYSVARALTCAWARRQSLIWETIVIAKFFEESKSWHVFVTLKNPRCLFFLAVRHNSTGAECYMTTLQVPCVVSCF